MGLSSAVGHPGVLSSCSIRIVAQSGPFPELKEFPKSIEKNKEREEVEIYIQGCSLKFQEPSSHSIAIFYSFLLYSIYFIIV